MPASTAVKRNDNQYTGADITVLKGLEAVRHRPAMYIGGVDSRGLHHLVWEIVDNSVDEYLAGHADKITVTLHKDGSSVSVSDNGRGIPVDKHPEEKRSTLEVILTTLHAGGKFSNKNYERSGGLHGVGSSVTNALSTEMIATVRRDKHEWQQKYEYGVPVTKVKKLRSYAGTTGTTIFFRPDDTIFSRVHFNAETIRQHLEDISYIHGGLQITFVDEVKKEKHELHHPDGINAFLEKIITEAKKKPVHDQTFDTKKDDRSTRVEVVFRWTDATDEQIRSYVNGIRTHGGGTHETGLRTGIAKAVRNYMQVHNVKVKGVSIVNDDIREGCTGILSVFHGDPMFQGQTKEKLNNSEMTSVVDGIVRPALENWLNSNPTIAEAVVGRIVLAARAREASRNAVNDVRRKKAGNGKTNLPGKLIDCSSRDPEETELFIVEGDSAGGTAAYGRNSKTQAVLPLRGKPMNTETLTPGKILNNKELSALVESLGTGIGNSFDIRRLRYGRVILLMDADSDGYHISTLMLNFFYRHMQELIDKGKLFIAQPPLYRISVGKDSQYALDDNHKEEILAALPENRKPEIVRFKGLGEMDSKQLKETTLDPRTRILLRVEVESPVEANNTFHQLMGNDASERYRVIMDESAFADDIDL